MLKRLLVVVVVVVAGCQGPEAFRARFSDAGTSTTGPGVGGSFGGGNVLPVMVTGTAGSVGTGGGPPDPLAGAAGGTVAGIGGTGGSVTGAAGAGGAGGGMMASAGTVGTAGAAGGSAGTGVVVGVDAGAGGGGRSGGVVDAGVVDAAPASVAYSSTNWKPTASITAAGTADLPPNAFDGKLTTRWTTGRNQMGDESFVVDLGQMESVSRVVLDDTTHPLDFPVAYTLEVSTNGTTFTAVKMGPGAMVTDIQFARVNARYIRIRQTGTTPAAGSWWSIDELRIFS